MSETLLGRRGHSKKILIILGSIFTFFLILVMLVAYGIAKRTSQRIQETNTLVYTPPTTPSKDQVKRLLLRRLGANGYEYLEILSDGTVNLYDANMKLIKSGLQGFGRITNLFKNFEEKINAGGQLSCPSGYQITIQTNRGTYTCSTTGPGSGSPINELIDEIEDIVDDTLSPTPTLRPTHTPPPGIPSRTPTPSTSSIPTPRVTDPNWNPLTPTPLPDYMTAPPFSCQDYPLGRPFTISNVICGVD